MPSLGSSQKTLNSAKVKLNIFDLFLHMDDALLKLNKR
jgi:hypothetical protein